MTPADPGPCSWDLPRADRAAPGRELVAVGADCAPATMLAGYRRGLFAMRLTPGTLGWFSPDPRAVLPIDEMRVSRSLRRSCRKYRVSVDIAFAEVLEACADRRRPGHWITDDLTASYRKLHRLGWAHSVEVWLGDQLAGGLFGVEVAGLFAAESMFHRETDASKVALRGLVERLGRAGGRRLLDVQWPTEHLMSLGCVAIPRQEYLGRLRSALDVPPTSW